MGDRSELRAASDAGAHVFLVAAVRPLLARGATGADDAKLSSSLSDPTKPSDSSSSSVSQASFFFGLGLGAAFFGAALAFAGAAFGAGAALGATLGAGFGFGAAGAFLGAGFFFCFAPVRRRRVSQVPNV